MIPPPPFLFNPLLIPQIPDPKQFSFPIPKISFEPCKSVPTAIVRGFQYRGIERGIDYQTRCKAVLKYEKDGVNITDYLLALDKAVGKCNDAVVDVLVSKNFDITSKSKSLIKGGSKSVREDVYDVIDCALVTSTKCEDLLFAAKTGDIGKFDVSGSYFQKCKVKDEYTPLDILVALG